MKIQPLVTSFKVAALVTALTCSLNARAATIPVTQTFSGSLNQSDFRDVAFRDSAEADMLRRAYRILATGDHDYKGHRAKAMHAVEEAGKSLDMDLHGDLKDRTPQPISDEKLREARGLIEQVLGASEVKDQKHITKHLNEAVKQIDTALTDR